MNDKIEIKYSFNKNKVEGYLKDGNLIGSKRYVKTLVTKSLKKSISDLLIENGFKVNVCNFCGRPINKINFSVLIEDEKLYIYDFSFDKDNPYLCDYKDCRSKKLNNNSIEKVALSKGLSNEEALLLIHSRNKSPFYKENHSSEEEYKKFQSRGEEALIRRYGESLGKDKFKSLSSKISYKNSKERYLNEDRLDDYLEINSKKAITLENLKRIYPEDKAIEIINNWKSSIGPSEKNYVKRYGEDDGKKRYKLNCENACFRFTETNYKYKYGEELGKLKYEERCKGCARTLDSFINKYGKDEGTKRYNSFLYKTTIGSGMTSKESWLFFIPIIKFCFKNNLCKEDIKIGTSKRKEFWLAKKDFGFYSYDFCIPKFKLIIEYNGERYHPNPNWSKEKWNSWRSVYKKETADEVFDKYQKKVNLTKEYGYMLIQVFSSDNFEEKYKEIFNLIQLRRGNLK